ncbi:hypothetical protein J4573_16235 [Actinomadura barringtoniae]|uniref:Uncharacterized protein n=1 Tax=Actinomadura barringtoniae TaxID=1427535 RepID=A0A939PHI4_9ACTN|nr:hypothetical protein [Actinomadura barringtoniae]MBO2448651.1 hypothetical protein [Actinomadura barringtoniae]
MATAIDLLASVIATTDYGEEAARLLGIGQQTWEVIRHLQFGIPELLAARQAAEHQARQIAGDTAYEAVFRKGLESRGDDGITWALHQDLILRSPGSGNRRTYPLQRRPTAQTRGLWCRVTEGLRDFLHAP